MLIMEQIEAAMYQKMKISGRLTEKQMERMQGVGRDLTMDRGQRENIIRWFVDTQAAPLLCDGSFPPWFQGFISRQEAEDQLRDRNVGCFLIRLSEKGIGYILSYKGHDRCRHFVINQTRTGLLVVSGDSTTHNSLTELIDHFKTTPIQPFGEYLTSSITDADSVEEDSRNELYDVVQNKPIIKLGVSVKALTSLWEQTSDAHHKTPSVLPSKSSRKLTTSTSFDRDSQSQAHTEAGRAALQPNPLYEGVCIKKEVQPESDYDNRTKSISKTLLFEDAYQVIPEQHDNDTYEHILEDIPASDNNTYASLEEMQPHTEKKNHKWWKFRPESKKN